MSQERSRVSFGWLRLGAILVLLLVDLLLVSSLFFGITLVSLWGLGVVGFG